MGERLGNKIREERHSRGLTQVALAEKIGVSRKTINTIENGIFIPSTVLALKIASAFERRVEDVFFLVHD